MDLPFYSSVLIYINNTAAVLFESILVSKASDLIDIDAIDVLIRNQPQTPAYAYTRLTVIIMIISFISASDLFLLRPAVELLR